MKRRDLIKRLRQLARAEGLDLQLVEGASHTKATIGDRQATIPRHREINELTAKAIIEQMTPPAPEGK